MVGTQHTHIIRPTSLAILAVVMLMSLLVACSSSDEVVEPVVFPIAEPTDGSEEAAIIDVFDMYVRALNIGDWDAYIENCNPERPMMNASQIEFLASNVFSTRVDLAGLNYRNVTVRIWDDGTAMTTSDEYSYDEQGVEVFYSYSKVDGKWYFNSNCSVAGT